jgi:hypothetical protein
MPYEDDPDDDYEDEDDEWEDDEEDQELPEPMSEDEQVNGSFPAPRTKPPKRRRRMPPMPEAPVPRKRKKGDVWHPPFEVRPDGTVVGVKVGEGLDKMPVQILEDGTRQEFDVEKGTMEGVAGIFRPPGSR